MEIQEIDVYIERDGKVRLEVRGVKGESCLDITKSLENALGGKIEHRELTPEAQQGVYHSERERLRQKSFKA